MYGYLSAEERRIATGEGRACERCYTRMHCPYFYKSGLGTPNVIVDLLVGHFGCVAERKTVPVVRPVRFPKSLSFKGFVSVMVVCRMG